MRNKISNFIKQYFFMLALVATFIGFSAFKFSDSHNTLQDGWYDVSFDNPNLTPTPDIPENLNIDGLSSPPPVEDEEGCAQTLNTGYRCTVYLDFDEEGSPDEPATLKDAMDDPDITVGTQARQPEE